MENVIINDISVLTGLSSGLFGGDTLAGEYRILFPEGLCTLKS